MDKTFLAKAFGVFMYMVTEAVLGKTKFGSWLGLAKAALWFILGVFLNRIFRLFKPRTNNVPKESQNADGRN